MLQEKESDKLQDQLDKIRDDEQARIRQIAKYEELINKLQRELDNPPEVEDNEPLVHRQVQCLIDVMSLILPSRPFC